MFVMVDAMVLRLGQHKSFNFLDEGVMVSLNFISDPHEFNFPVFKFLLKSVWCFFFLTYLAIFS